MPLYKFKMSLSINEDCQDSYDAIGTANSMLEVLKSITQDQDSHPEVEVFDFKTGNKIAKISSSEIKNNFGNKEHQKKNKM